MPDQNYSALGYNIREIIIITTNLYPVEISEDFASTANIIAGYIVNSTSEAFQLSNSMLAGDIIQTRQFAYGMQPPEAFSYYHNILSGEAYEAKTLAYADIISAYTASNKMLNGSIESVGIKSPYIEGFEANAVIKYGTLSTSEMYAIDAVMEETQSTAIIINGTKTFQYTPSNPYSNNVTLFMPMFGADGGVSFPDYSKITKYATVHGDSKTIITQSKYYGSSAYFDGNG